MVYEGRPNVTVDAAGLALKSRQRGAAARLVLGRAVQHRPGRHPARRAGHAPACPQDAVQLLPCHDRASVHHLITARGLVDLVIPRGGAGLIAAVVEQATVPTVETGTGNCHVYVDATADLARAEQIVINSKARRPSVCNAAETLLVHASLAEIFLPRVLEALAEAGVTVHGDDTVQAVGGSAIVARPPTPTGTPNTSRLDIAVRGRRLARRGHRAHRRALLGPHRGDRHRERLGAAREFAARVDSAAVMVNASTAFTDGAEFGIGAEIGISTQKLHARGPMGLTELTSTKWLVWGDGQIRGTA